MSEMVESYERLQARAELLDFLLDVADLTHSTLDLDELLSQVAGIISRVLPQDLMAIMLYSRRLKGLRIVYSRGHREELTRSLVIPLGEGITGIAGERMEPVVIEDVRNDPNYWSSVDAVRSEMAVPMISRGRLVGVIDLQSTQVNAYSREHVALGRLLASRIAAAIENARLHRRLAQQKQTLEILAKLARELATLDLDTVFERVAESLKGLISFDALGVYLLDETGTTLNRRFTVRAWGEPLPAIPLGKGITGTAALSKQVVRVGDVTKDPRYIEANPGIMSEVALPLLHQGKLVGILDLESRKPNRFNDDEVRLLTLVARELAVSVDNAQLYEKLRERERRLEQDLSAAHRVQSLLLPREAPRMKGLQVGINQRAARQISGDIYDFFVQPDGRAVLAFGDVSGKGAAAALYGALMSGLLRSYAPDEQSPSALLKNLNDLLLERKVDTQYVTLTVLFWNPETRQLIISNAGALPPMIVRDGTRIELEIEGVPLGLLPNQTYDEVCITTQPGDWLVMFSDGIADQENLAGDNFGEARLLDIVRATTGDARSLVESVYSELDKFMLGKPVQDDQTVVAIKVEPLS